MMFNKSPQILSQALYFKNKEIYHIKYLDVQKSSSKIPLKSGFKDT